MQIRHALNILGRNSLFLHFRAVVRHIVPHVAHLLYQPLILPRKNLLPVRSFNFLLVIPFHFFHLLLYTAEICLLNIYDTDNHAYHRPACYTTQIENSKILVLPIYALRPSSNAFLFNSRNFDGTLCSMASIHSSSVKSKCFASLPISTRFTALLLPASSARDNASSAST